MTSNNNDENILRHFGGMSLNNLRNILLDMENIEPTIESVSHSPYIDCSILGGYLQKFKNPFSVLSLNIQCLSAKFNAFSAFLSDLQHQNVHFTALCLQETWLKDHDDISLFQIPGYVSVSLQATCSSHGGIIIYLSEDYQFKNLDLYERSVLWEGIFLEVTDSLENKFIICNIYRPPRDTNESLETFITSFGSKVEHLSNISNVIIVGDLNIDLLSIHLREKFSDYLDLMITQGFVIQLSLPTRFSLHRATLIDHIFTKLSSSYSMYQSGILFTQISDHLPSFICIEKHISKPKLPKYVNIQICSQAAQNAFINEINNFNFSEILNTDPNTDPNQNYRNIINTLQTFKNKHMPYKSVRFKRYHHKISPWLTNGILRSIKYKDSLYKKLKLTQQSDPIYNTLKINFHTYCKILKKSMAAVKKSYYQSQLTLHMHDSRKTWKLINSLLNAKKSKTDFPHFFLIENQKVSNEQQIADHFNKFFASIGHRLASNITSSSTCTFNSHLNNPRNLEFNFQPVNINEIIKIINQFKPKTSIGNDNLSMKLLKKISVPLSGPISIIINQSLCTGIFPDDLKTAKILPLFKKDCNKILDNYRPISLLPCISKIFERVVYNQIYAFFEFHKLFYFSQHGFRKKHSTETATLEFIDKIFNHLDNDKIPIAIFIDLSKAFDTIDHDILLTKLHFYGVRGTSLEWFRSYLDNRKQYVFYNNHASSLCLNTVGVPQGSILGPLLFIIYMNDICHVSPKFNTILYADDTTLESPLCSFNFLTSPDPDVISSSINDELSKISDWLSANKLSVNANKSKYMIFHFPQRHKNTLPQLTIKLNGQNITEVSEFNFLGITIDETLSWKPHINKICNKISRSIGTLKRLNKILPVKSLTTLYNSLIMPHILYGILAWGHQTNRLDKLQKRAVRVICNAKYNAHTFPLFKSLRILKVQDVFRLTALKWYFKEQHNMLPCYFSNLRPSVLYQTHHYNTRFRDLAVPPRPNKSSCKNCLRFFIPQTILETPPCILDKIQTHSYEGFTRYAKTFFLNEYTSLCLIPNCYICRNY